VIAIILTLLVTVGLVLNGLRLRARIPRLLPAADASADDLGRQHQDRLHSADLMLDSADWMWITAPGAVIDGTTRAEAAAYARAGHLDLLELVPADLPVTAARDLLRAVDPKSYQADRLAPGRGAGVAVLAARSVGERAGTLARAGLSPAEVIDCIRRIKPYARSRGASLVCWGSNGKDRHGAAGAGDEAGSGSLAGRRARLRANDVTVPVYLTLDFAPWVLIVIALLFDWQWGAVAVAAYCLQPYLIFAATGMRPRGLHVAALLRPVHAPYVAVRTVVRGSRSAGEVARDAALAAAVPYYQAALVLGTERFFEARRPDCPWCGSVALSVLVRSPDLFFGKPGTFTLERCDDCGHVFQNPRLRPDGLGFYYRDIYDGLGAEELEGVFASGAESYRGRTRMVASITTPKSWLDVGTGHAHFCAAAAEVWPDAVFDGLDQGAGVKEAEDRGWITTAYRGEFRDLADVLTGRYDVISMHHYLEHTRDPLAEIDTAARVLPPGGYLLIELPDPQWPLARFFGRYWMPWFQPQHQHLMPAGNLMAALAERGLEPVAVERAPAHIPNDFVVSAGLLISRIAPLRTWPWSPSQPTKAVLAWRTTVWMMALPAIVLAALLDRTVGAALVRHWDHGNAYRILARRQHGTGEVSTGGLGTDEMSIADDH
jgi:SAM-dependent methyltransferase